MNERKVRINSLRRDLKLKALPLISNLQGQKRPWFALLARDEPMHISSGQGSALSVVWGSKLSPFWRPVIGLTGSYSTLGDGPCRQSRGRAANLPRTQYLYGKVIHSTEYSSVWGVVTHDNWVNWRFVACGTNVVWGPENLFTCRESFESMGPANNKKYWHLTQKWGEKRFEQCLQSTLQYDAKG